MEYFHQHMKKGDYFIIEDCCPDTPQISGQGYLVDEYERWGSEKLTTLKKFLNKFEEFYNVDTFYTDFFG